LWIDAAIAIKRPIDPLFNLMAEKGYLLFREDHSIGEYCKDDALSQLGIGREESFGLPSCWACVVGLNLTYPCAGEFLEKWIALANDGISFKGPKWSGVRGFPRTASVDPRVKGHRHDQAAASVLALKLGMTEWTTKALFGTYFHNQRHEINGASWATRFRKTIFKHFEHDPKIHHCDGAEQLVSRQ
jgi:hypothetical protein